ncbi:uncharacterized protein LOC134287587 [Aedes albopictus]|uniref:BZIP domain-containing protein n=1 Tax=Aedes albopictus TaxID=7160 RepID=A0ABM1ZMY7_AEDAL
MPPKKKNASSKNPKTAGANNRQTKRVKECANDGEKGIRTRAKTSNQHYLKNALEAAMVDINGEAYAAGGLNFVATNSIRLSEEQDRFMNTDPLDLSLKESSFRQQTQTNIQGLIDEVKHLTVEAPDDPLRRLSQKRAFYEVDDLPSDDSEDMQFDTQAKAAQGTTDTAHCSYDDIEDVDDNDVVESSQPTIVATKKVPSQRRGLVAEIAREIALLTHDVSNPIEESTQMRHNADPDADREALPHVPDVWSLEEWRPPRPGTPKADTVPEPGTSKAGAVPDARIIPTFSVESAATGNEAEVSSVSNKRKEGSKHQQEGGKYRKKYLALMRKYREKCEALKKQKEKNQKQLLKIAELKDLLVFANVEAKKAQLDPNAKHVSDIVHSIANGILFTSFIQLFF